MGNYLFKNNNNIKYNNDWLVQLKQWEKKIKNDNYERYRYTNNKPEYIGILNNWTDQIKINNFKRNNDTNNPPNYISDLKNENNNLSKKIKNLNLNYKIDFSYYR